MKRVALLLSLVLPVAGLAATWAWTESWTSEGTDWEVPIRGFDPRDLLRGHYIEFTYDWPGDRGDDSFTWIGQFCIEGTPPVIDRVNFREDVSGCRYFAKPAPGTVYSGYGLATGRLYVPQRRAPEIEDKLRNADLRGIVTVRQRTDGRIIPQSIRFRPLTAEERAARDAPDEESDTPPLPLPRPNIESR